MGGCGVAQDKGACTNTIIVIGAGTMGAGIAASAAAAGYAVALVESAASARERAAAGLTKTLGRLLPEGTAAADAFARISLVESLAQAPPGDLYIEAVPELLDLKHTVFAELDRVAPAPALLATNTSSLAVSEIAKATGRPQNVVGIHFFNPPALMKLVEVVRAEQSSEESVRAAVEFVERLGKVPVVVRDTPGFIVNRVARPYYLEALRAIDAGTADAESVDAILEGLGFKMGPCRLMDLIGLDVNLATTRSVYEATQLERLRPSPLQERMVAEGRLGRKSARGFYDYGK
ncbi:3-hydroxybutyryl-CoA dehydrogenase [bacterium]|nr:MAG: 3-hydroxybutyryl-CoA dehydrogenase [bacterium]